MHVAFLDAQRLEPRTIALCVGVVLVLCSPFIAIVAALFLTGVL